MLQLLALKISCRPEKVVWRRKTCRGGICARSWSQTWRVQPEEYLKKNLLLKVVMECNSFVPFVTRPFPHWHSWTSIRSSICKSKFHNCSHLDLSWQTFNRCFPCEECHEVFDLKWQYEEHRASKHGDQLETSQCPECPQTFSQRTLLLAHMQTFHKERWKSYHTSVFNLTIHLSGEPSSALYAPLISTRSTTCSLILVLGIQMKR